MRLVLPIGSPEFIGSTNFRMAADSGNFLMVGKDATLLYQPGSSSFDARTLNATNTGAVLGGTFTTNSGGTITAPGTYTNIRFTGQVTVQPSAANINATYLFRNCYFQGTNNGFNQCLIPDDKNGIPTNIFFEYCTFDDLGTGIVNGLTGAFNTATRCYFKGFNNCIQIYDPCSIIECANDGLMNDNVDHNAHFDCIENNGAPNVNILRCKWINNWDQTSAIMNNNEFGDIYNINIDQCYLEGGGFPLYMDGMKNTANRAGPVNLTRSIIAPGYWQRNGGNGYFYDQHIASQPGIVQGTGANANTFLP